MVMIPERLDEVVGPGVRVTIEACGLLAEAQD
jgi:hypothetical protein